MKNPCIIAECIAEASAQLAPITDTPRLEAELLLAHALNITRARLLARLRDTADVAPLAPLLARRLNHEPLSYIFGEWEFFGLPFFVRRPLLTPRPETEHLVERALAWLSGCPKERPVVADVCCGTGCVAVSIGKHAPGASVFACDLRREAVTTTLLNAQRHELRVQCIQGDLLTAVNTVAPSFDLIVSNPPYVPEQEWGDLSPVITKYEDPLALLAGEDGLAVIRRIVPQAHCCLRPGGMLAMEIGEGQFDAVAALMRAHGFSNVAGVRDLAGIQRIISGVCVK